MDILLGATKDPAYLAVMQQHGFGRMMVEKWFDPYPGEPWAADNCAFSWAKRGIPFQWQTWVDRMERIERAGLEPYFAVIPDSPCLDGNPQDSSLDWSIIAYYHTPVELLPWRWYLAVQDGMEPAEVAEALEDERLGGVRGIFLGGSDRFKAREGATWCDFAHERDLCFHYARASTPRKLRHALGIGADSVDTSFPLWTRARFARFVDLAVNGSPQAELFPWSLQAT